MLISGDGVAIAQLLDVVIRQENTRFADKASSFHQLPCRSLFRSTVSYSL
jgi:hypothetical protein